MTSPLFPAGLAPVDSHRVGEGTAIPSALPGKSSSTSSTTSGVPFANLLADAVASANAAQGVAEAKTQAFAAGTLDDIHGTMIAVKQADIELKLVANVRNKLVEAFNDLWRMNI